MSNFETCVDRRVIIGFLLATALSLVLILMCQPTRSNGPVARCTMAQVTLKASVAEIETTIIADRNDAKRFQRELVRQGNAVLHSSERTGAVCVEFLCHMDRWIDLDRNKADERLILARLYFRENDNSISRLDYLSDGTFDFAKDAGYIRLGEDYTSFGSF